MFKVSSLNSKVSLWATLSIIFILSLCAHGSALAAEPITPTDLTITPTPSSSISPEQETDLKGSSVISPVAAGAIPVDVLTPPVTHSGLSALNKSKSTGGPKPFKVKGHGKKPTPDVLLSYYYTSYFGSSGWWDSDWEYRKSVTLSRASGAITDYQMKCVINRSTGTDGSPNAYDVYVNTKCNSDYSDIRFINSSETPLDYWIEISDTSSATVWVEFDSIGASDTTFYMYYGNTEASAYSNGVSTFDFFDHFADLTQWGTIGSVSVAGSICTVLRTGDVDAYVYSNSKFPINTAIRARLKSKHFGGSYIEDFGYNNWGVDAKSARGYYSYPYTFPQRYVTYNTGWVNVGAITGVVADTYFIQDVIRNSNSSIIFKVNDANTVTATSDLPVIDLNILSSAVIYNNSETDIDWVLVRKYTTNEPAWGTWGAESQYQPDTTQPVIYHPEPGGGHDGQTFSFDGVDDYVQIGNPSVLQLQYFTALAWIKTSYSPYNIVFSHAPVGSSGWGLAITPEAVYFDDAWVATVLSYSVNLVDGNWHQVGIYRGTDNGIGIIVDGQIVATGTYSSTFGFSNFQIGKRGSGDPYSNPFAGQIDEVAIYDNGLNAQNINDLYTTSKHTTAHVFKREVVISNTGSALTDYQVRADVTYNNRMQSDFDDLRFFDITGTALSYWIESYTAGVSATAWVKAPNLAASSNTTIEMYYGDPNAASDSNGDDTFILFDDFSDDLSKWDTIETGAGTWTPEISGGQLKITAVSNTSGNPCLRSTDEISGDVIIECKVNAISNGTRTWWAIGRGTNLVWWNWREGCNLMFDNHSTIKWAVMSSKDTSGTYYVNNPLLSGYPTPSLNTDYYLRFAVGNAVNGVKNSWAGTSTNYTSYITSSTLSYTHTDKVLMTIRAGVGTPQVTYFDDLKVRKYAATEPTASIGSETSVDAEFSVAKFPGLVAWWSADATTNDLWGSNNGTLVNGAGYNDIPEMTDLTPTISASYFDTGVGIDVSTARMFLDDEEVSPTAVTIEDISYIPLTDLVSGQHIALVQVDDLNGNSKSISWTFTVNSDTTAPVTCTIVINNGISYAGSRDVVFTLSAQDPESGVSWMRFSNDNINWSDWTPYVTSTSWTLTEGDGTKTVYAQYKNYVGLISDPVSGTIILDTTPAEITIDSPVSGNTYTIADMIPISYTAYDNESGIIYENANLPLNEQAVSNTEQIDATTLRLGENPLLVIAGNGAWLFADKSIKFRVIVTIPALEDLVVRYYGTGQISDVNVYNSLITQLNDIETSINQGLTNTAVSQMTTLIDYIKGQSGISISSDIAQLLIKYVENHQVRISLPTETKLYLLKEWMSAASDPNDFSIHLPDGTDVKTTLRGSMNLRFEPTADPDIASVSILNSEITGTPITVNGIDFGTLYFSQDPYNSSIGTLDLNSGYLNIIAKQLITSTYLTSPVPLETTFNGVDGDIYLMGSGQIPAGTPGIGGSSYTVASTSSPNQNKKGDSISWSSKPITIWSIGPITTDQIGPIIITRTGNTVTVEIRRTPATPTIITLVPPPPITQTQISIPLSGTAISITFFQAPAAGKDGAPISTSDLGPASKYGKIIVIDVASTVSPSIVISNTQIVTCTYLTEYPDGRPVTPSTRVIPETNLTSTGKTYVMIDFPGRSIPENGEPGMKNCVKTVTYVFSTEIWMQCPDTGVWVYLGWFEWSFVTTIIFDGNGKVFNSTVVCSPVIWHPAG